MANHASALKRARQNEIRRQRNRSIKSRVKHVVKQVRQVATEGATDQSAAAFKTAQSVIDKAAKKGTLHPRTAARRVSRLAKLNQKSAA